VKTIDAIERELDTLPAVGEGAAAARRLLELAEEVLEAWVAARGGVPTQEQREGFRLLALHRQGAQDLPSFNACRETCREIAYHYNLLALPAPRGEAAQRLKMMGLLVRHLALFVGGKLEVEKLGDFCCASRPLRTDPGDHSPQ
jgi:hypothetical protein